MPGVTVMNMQAGAGCFLHIPGGCGSLGIGAAPGWVGNGSLAIGEEGGDIDLYFGFLKLSA